MNGKIRKKIDLQSAKNNDWEDITSDGVHLYIADFGNNSSSRKELTIYKLNIEELLTEESPAFEIILYSYKEQIDDKPQDNLFDAEALAYHNDSLWIITKPNPKKWSGNAVIYKAPVIPGKYTLAHSGTLFTGSDSWISDAVTGADFHNGKLYVTTYNRVIQFNFAENKLLQSNFWGYNEPSQMESIATKSDGTIVLANEKNRLLGGGNLYYLRIDVDNH